MGFLNKLFSGTAGTCGKNLRWELNGDTLIISGTGEMENYQCGIRSRTAPAPWFDLSGSTKKIIVNDGVTTIGNSAFYNFTKVTDVKIPNSLTKIGDGAFFYCWSLKEIQLSDSVLNIGNRAFGSCWALMYVTIPNSVVDIGAWAFSGCESLKTITIPASVTNIGKSIFAACVSLKEIHYPAGRGFEKNLQTGYGAKLIPYNVAPPAVTQPKPTTQTVTRPTAQPVAEKLTWSFVGKTLTVGGVRVIENFPYAQIPWLKHLHDIQRIIIGNGVEKISPHAFDDCTRLEILELPASVKTIGDMAFSVSFCGSINGIKNVFWCLEDGVLVLKKNPDVSPAADFSTGSISWIFAEKNIRSIKIEDGVKPTGKFFEWMVQRFNGKEISFGE